MRTMRAHGMLPAAPCLISLRPSSIMCVAAFTAQSSYSQHAAMPHRALAPGAQVDMRRAHRQRVAAFLQPQDALYFETGGRAVVVYDHEYALESVG